MDKYRQYILEREGADLYEDENGFFTYRIEAKEFFVCDLFVLPDRRRDGHGKNYHDIIASMAKNNKCKRLTCTVCYEADNWEESKVFIESLGFKFLFNKRTLLYYVKDI